MENILFSLNIPINSISVSFLPYSSRQKDCYLDAQIDERWEQVLFDAKRQGKNIWNSSLYRFERLEQNQSTIHITFSQIEYKEMIVWRKYEQNASSKEREPNAVFAGSIIRTLDDKYVFGSLSGKTFLEPQSVLIGGVLSKNETILNSGEDIWEFVLKEAKEEIGLEKECFFNPSLLGIIKTPDCAIGIIFYSHVRLSFQEIASRFSTWNDGELASIEICHEKELISYLKNGKHYFPILALLFQK